MQLNINDFVLVKLTSKGVDVLEKWVPTRYETKYSVCTLFPVRPDGTTEFALWELMTIFGRAVEQCQDKPFEDMMTVERIQRDVFYNNIKDYAR
jgi:hypothetical protein